MLLVFDHLATSRGLVQHLLDTVPDLPTYKTWVILGVALVPLALKGVSYRPVGASQLLKRNLLIYGVGGLVAPFIGIKLIDLILVFGGLI